jgi:hypothetical protein
MRECAGMSLDGSGLSGSLESNRAESGAKQVCSLRESQLSALDPGVDGFERPETLFVATPFGGDHPKTERFLRRANCPPDQRRVFVVAAFGKNAREPREAVSDVTVAVPRRR